MANYLLGIDVQDFDQTMFSADDLSTIRGASLMALEAVLGVQVDGVELDAISLGRSSGLWQMTAANATDAANAIATLRTKLPKLLSFAVAAIPMPHESDFLLVKKQLKAALARQQMASLADPYPEETGAPCPVDLVRPVGNEKRYYKTVNRQLSPSVIAKRRVGMDGKQAHIARHIDKAALPERVRGMLAQPKSAPFALLLSSISEGAAPMAELRANLNDKIAVVHLDGNGFGAKQDAYVLGKNAIERQRAFDQALAGMRTALVTAALNAVTEGGGIGKPSADEVQVRSEVATFRTDEVIRMEMLLWGGDEMTFIVPARLGWPVVDAMAKAIDGHWKLDNGQALSASIGLVFCHHDAPITRIRELADTLAGRVKETRGRDLTHIWPMVLESFDHIGGQLDHYLTKHAAGVADFFMLTPTEFASLQELAEDLFRDDGFSRSRLRALAQAASDGRVRGGSDQAGQSQLAYLLAKKPLTKPQSDDLSQFDTPEAYYRRAWMLLEEYWDYLNPYSDPERAQIRQEEAA